MNTRAALAAVAVVLVLAACGSRPPHWASEPADYVVRRGDTLYSIAFRHGLDWRDVARWNGVRAPRYVIHVGDTLKLSGPATTVAPRETARRTQSTPTPTPATLAVKFRWPAVGEVVPADGKGIAIRGRIADPVIASAAGRVVYTGSGLIGYGKLIIVKHNNQLLSAYAHNDEILVREGDDVTAGQRIATMGEGPGRRAMLHFEIRVDGRAVDPMQYLPPR
ncbi:MAG: peptidoglycan DD-metalloendopeptidase family protein [Gammaproteobacteria bacterium]